MDATLVNHVNKFTQCVYQATAGWVLTVVSELHMLIMITHTCKRVVHGCIIALHVRGLL